MTAFNPQSRQNQPKAQTTLALYRIGQAMGHMLRETGKQRHLSPAQIQTLLFLTYARPGVRTIGGLTERLGLTYATTSGVVDALERKGFVERRPLPTDRRTITLWLTETGQAEVTHLEDVLADVETAVGTLSATEQQMFVVLTQAIVRQLQQAGRVQVAEMCWGCHYFREGAHPNHPQGPHHCAFIDAPLPEPNTYLECPDFIPLHRVNHEA